MVKLIECSNTWQGEGPDTGKRMLLTRFKYCNKSCNFCDTQVRMRTSLELEIKLKSIQYELNKNKLGLLITGGEPTFSEHFEDTVKMLNELDYNVANVETNGFRLEELIKKVDKNKNIKYIYSPKAQTDNELEENIKLFNNISSLESVFYKIVVGDGIYGKYTNKFLEYIEDKNVNDRLYLMPLGTNREELIKNSAKVFDTAEKFKCNFSSRQHIIYEFI